MASNDQARAHPHSGPGNVPTRPPVQRSLPGQATPLFPHQTITCSVVSRSLLVPYVLGLAGLSLIYLIVEHATFSTIRDPFVPLGAVLPTLFLVFSVTHVLRIIGRHAHACYLDLVSAIGTSRAENAYHSLCIEVFQSRSMMLVGMTYALVFASLPFVLVYWDQTTWSQSMQVFDHHLWLQVAFGAILFLYNFLPGALIWGLYQLHRRLVLLAEDMHIKLWERESASLYFLLHLSSRVAVLLSIYTALSVVATLTTLLPRWIVIPYCLASGMALLILVLQPALIVRDKSRVRKAEALGLVHRRLQDEFTKTFEDAPSPDAPLNRDTWDQLQKYRDDLNAVPTLPFKLQTYGSLLSIAVLTWSPAILDMAGKVNDLHSKLHPVLGT